MAQYPALPYPPPWLLECSDPDLRLVAATAYASETFAVRYGADHDARCERLMARARQALRRMEEHDVSILDRVNEGRTATAAFVQARMMRSDSGKHPRLALVTG